MGTSTNSACNICDSRVFGSIPGIVDDEVPDAVVLVVPRPGDVKLVFAVELLLATSVRSGSIHDDRLVVRSE